MSKESDFVDLLNKEMYELKIADLEAKLAESEHRNEQLVDALNGKVFINYKLPMENAQLKQQLKDTEESFNNTMRYLNKIRSELLNLHKN